MNYATSILFSIGATAGTYLVMHLVLAPRLQASSVEVPAVTGMSAEQARGLTDPRGLLLVLDGERIPESDKVVPGTLFEQNPLPGSRLHVGEKIHVIVARAPQLVRVPQLSGQPVAAARQALGEAGLRAGTVTEAASSTVAAGLVVQTQPPAGSELRREETVELVVSRGSEQVTVPNLRGRSLSSARQLLEQAGFALGEQHKGVDDNAADGVVLRQSPAAGTQVPKGQKIDLVINE